MESHIKLGCSYNVCKSVFPWKPYEQSTLEAVWETCNKMSEQKVQSFK